MDNTNWDVVKRAFIEGEVLGIPMPVEGETVVLVGMVHEIDISEASIVLETSKFKQALPEGFQGIGIWDIDVSAVEGDIKVIEYTPDILVGTSPKPVSF